MATVPLTLSMLQLAAKPYRPPEAIALREEIDGRMRALELRTSVLGLASVTKEDIEEITFLRLKLDRIYLNWMAAEAN